jgi:hypothetical protein
MSDEKNGFEVDMGKVVGNRGLLPVVPMVVVLTCMAISPFLAGCDHSADKDIAGVITELGKIKSGERAAFKPAEVVQGDWELVCIQGPYTNREQLEGYAKRTVHGYKDPDGKSYVLWFFEKGERTASVKIDRIDLMAYPPKTAVICAPFSVAEIASGREQNGIKFYLTEGRF